MTTDTTASVCQLPAVAGRSRCLAPELDALQATVAQLQQQLAAARKDSSTSSKPPSSDIVKPPKPPPPPGQDAAQARRPARTSRAPARPVPARDARLRRPPTTSWTPAPAAAGTCSLTDAAEPIVVQQVDIAAVPLEIHEHRSHPGWCPHCRKVHYAPLPLVDRARRPGRAAADHPDRLPQGGLPRLVLDHPQVPPRRRRRDHLARATGQDHRQGQPGAGAALRGVARRPARAGGAQRR